MAHDGHDTDRRTVLRSIAVGSTLALGAGVAAGDRGVPSDSVLARRRDLEARFGDVGSARRVVAAEAGPVVDELAELGYVESGTVDDVAVESFLRKPDYRSSDAAGVATVGPGRVGDVEVAVVNVRQRAGSHEIEYYLHPDHGGEGYAVVTPVDGGPSVLVEPGHGERVGVTASCGDCATGCTCEERCDWDETHCDCVPGDHLYYPRDVETCLELEDGSCGCDWCEEFACDCQGEEAPVCPE